MGAILNSEITNKKHKDVKNTMQIDSGKVIWFQYETETGEQHIALFDLS